MKELYYGYDLGSHGAKGAVYDSRGNRLAAAFRSHSINRPQPGWQEQEPEGLWWREFLDISRELKEQMEKKQLQEGAGARGALDLSIAGIGITGFVPGLCAVDQTGKPLGPAIMHTDIRAQRELGEVNRKLESPITLGTLLPKLLWLRRHKPELFKAIAAVLVPHTYLVYKLTGRMVCDYDTASIYGGIFNSDLLQWDEHRIRDIGIDPAILPEPVAVDSVVGSVGAGEDRFPGLGDFLGGARVIAGTGDSFAALLGEGAVRPGDLMIYLGSSATKILVETELERLTSGPHYGEGKARFVGRIFSSGESMEHYRRLLGHDGWEELDRAAGETPAGSGGTVVIPHRKQRTGNEGAGLDRETIVGLEVGRGQGYLFRAFLEGVACRIRQDLEALEQEGGMQVKRILLAGGGAKSSLFCSIIASTLQRPVHVTPVGGGTAGMALLAAISCGDREISGSGGSLTTMAESWFAQRSVHNPLPEWEALYQQSFLRFQELAVRVEELHRLID